MGGDDVKFAEIHAKVSLLRVGLGAIAIGPIPLMLQVPTVLAVQMKQENQDWITIEEIPVDKCVPTNPLTGQPAPDRRPEPMIST